MGLGSSVLTTINFHLEENFINGLFNPMDNSIKLKGEDTTTDYIKTLTHEYVHALQLKYPEKLYDSAEWIIEGFADSLAKNIIEHGNLVPKTKNNFYSRKFASLVVAYTGISKNLGLKYSLPEKFEKMEGEMGSASYSYGYSFFQIREKQLGKGIYEKIFKDNDLTAVAPLPLYE